MDIRTISLFIEAFLMLGCARILLLFKFAVIAPSLGFQSQETSAESQKEEIHSIKHISSAIAIMSKHTPWSSTCLIRAIAGMRMLERRRINSTLYLGTAKDEYGQLIAHAWLRSGSFYISGADVKDRYIIVDKFAKTVRIE